MLAPDGGRRVAEGKRASDSRRFIRPHQSVTVSRHCHSLQPRADGGRRRRGCATASASTASAPIAMRHPRLPNVKSRAEPALGEFLKRKSRVIRDVFIFHFTRFFFLKSKVQFWMASSARLSASFSWPALTERPPLYLKKIEMCTRTERHYFMSLHRKRVESPGGQWRFKSCCVLVCGTRRLPSTWRL